jgi:hypothetical protein
MDAEGLRHLLEKKSGRPCNEVELRILSNLTVRDCVRIWDDVAFTDADFDLAKYVPYSQQRETELTPQRRQTLCDIRRVREALARLGILDAKDGYQKTTFYTLRTDGKLKGQVDSIASACRLARKEGLVFFDCRDLTLGHDDGVKIVLLPADPDPTDAVATRSSGTTSPPPKAGTATPSPERRGSVVNSPNPRASGLTAGPPTPSPERRGSTVTKPKPVPVTGEEMNAVLEALGRLAVSKTGKMKAKFGALLADPALAEMGPVRVSAVCAEAKAGGQLQYITERLQAGVDENVYVELLGGDGVTAAVHRDAATA